MSDAFGERLVEIMPRLRRFAITLTYNDSEAEDLLHDTIVRALVKQHQFVDDTHKAALWNWCSGIMYTRHVNDLRHIHHKATPVPWPTNGQGIPNLDIASIGETATGTIYYKQVLKELEKLLPERQQALRLWAFDGHSYETIADIVGVPMGTIRSRLSRGRAEMRERVG